MKLHEEHLETLRRAVFPAMAVLACVVLAVVFGVQLLARPDRALPTDTSWPDEGAHTVDAATARDPLIVAPSTAGATLPNVPDAADVAIERAASSAIELDHRLGSSAEEPGEVDRLRSQVLRVAAEYPGSSRGLVLVRRLASISPAEALACVAQLPDDRVRAEAVSVIAIDWVARDAAGAIAACAGFRDAPIGREFHREVVGELARTKPARALSLVTSLASREDSLALLAEVFRRWAVTDPRLATARALDLEAGPERSLLLADVLTAWAQQQLPDAVRAVLVLPQEEQRPTLAGMVRRLTRHGEGDPATGAAFIRAVMLRARETISDRERYSLAAAALDVLGEIDAGVVVTFLDSLPGGYDRSILLTRLVTEAAAVAPLRAAVYATRCATGAERVAAIRLAASGMVRADEAGALRWIEQITNADDRAAATQAVFFGISDLSLAEEWLQSRMGKMDADAAIQAFVLRVTRDDPPLAASWARQIGDPSLRYFAIEAVARAWLRTNRPALEAWLVRTDLPESRVNRLLAR